MKEGRGAREEGRGKREEGGIMEFTDLRVWQEAKELVLKTYKVTAKFPKAETYTLSDQLKRSTNSICANIAEGFNRFHAKDKIRFYYNARGSISESQSHLLISQDLNYLNKDEVDKLVQELTVVGVKLNNMIASLFRIAASRNKSL
ncbi:MAG: four helix bundle protein [Candidatus Margulisiibacteriota bacterium]